MKKRLITSFAVAIVLVAAMLIPAVAGTQQTISPEAVQILQGPRVHVIASNSSNWAGYAAAENASVNTTTGELYDGTDYVVTNVTGTWVVPSATGSKKSIAYSSVWVGIDGYDSTTVEQVGTEQDSIHGHGRYYAWFEMYPNLGYRILAPVKPGDTITAGVQYDITNEQFILTISDSPAKGKRGWIFTTTQQDFTPAAAMRDSAEWIVEAPSSLSGDILPLADFGTVHFAGAQATLGGATGSINDWPYDAITMIDGSATATPSDLSPGGAAFNVTFS